MSTSRHDRFEALLARIDRLTTAPETLELPLWDRVRGSVSHWWSGRLLLSREHLAVLCSSFDGERDAAIVDAQLDAALEELETNVVRAERMSLTQGQVPTAQLLWLFRVTRSLSRFDSARSAPASHPARRFLRRIDPLIAAPPLDVQAPKAGDADGGPPLDSLQLQLAAIDHLIDAARAETSVLAKRRRLLEGARRILLELGAAVPLEPEAHEARKAAIADEIVQIDRFESAGLRGNVGLLHQARGAMSRGDRERAVAALSALDTFATGAFDVPELQRTGQAMETIWGRADPSHDKHRTPSTRQSVSQQFGRRALDVIDEALVQGRKDAVRQQRKLRRESLLNPDRELAELAKNYLAPGCEKAMSHALLATDGWVDVGAALSPVRASEIELRARVVDYPTQDLKLLPAQSAADVPHAIISDPRMLLLDLATGRLLTRKFVDVFQTERTRTKLVGEVRVYVLDGSTSMMSLGHEGSRARMRDALLLAELATCLQRFEASERFTRVVLFYRYFTKRLESVHRVDTPESALAAMGQVASSTRGGGTDIQSALISSLQLIHDAQGRDEELAQAQIVLITDGNAAVDEQEILAERDRLGSLSVGISVVALGEENEALRELVARQRKRGERAFYHFISDRQLAAIVRGDFARQALHVPDHLLASPDWDDEVRHCLDELAAIERARAGRGPDLPLDDLLVESYQTLGLSVPALSEGDRARQEEARRDRAALDARFDRWFPRIREASSLPAVNEPRAPLVGEAEAVAIILSTVAEVIGDFGGRSETRRADAIGLIERLLPSARLSPARYVVTLEQHSESLHPYMTRVRMAAGVERTVPSAGPATMQLP